MRKTAEDVIVQKKDIIETAYRFFSEMGYTATNMEDIASALGISRTPLYYHFQNKETLFMSVVEHYYEIALKRHKATFNSSAGIFEKISLDLNSCYEEKTGFLERLLSDIEVIERKNPTVKELHKKYVMETFKIKCEAVNRAIQSGELLPDTDIQHFVAMIFSGYYCLVSDSAKALLDMADIDIKKMVELYINMMRKTYQR